MDNGVNYEAFSPVTRSEVSIAPLRNLPLRLYTEPDTAWWRTAGGDG